MIDPAVVAEIEQQLVAIERTEQVRVLYACESGSRARGFPSADSDYDEQVRTKKYFYALIQAKRAGFESELAPRIPIIQSFIDREYARLRDTAFGHRQPLPDPAALNALFREVVW